MSKNKADKPVVNFQNWVNEKVADRTVESLQRMNEAFPVDHAEDSNEQLIAYLKQMAAEIGYSPCEEEVIGGEYISKRFGGWAKAIWAAGLSLPKGVIKLERRKIYKDEYKVQMKLFKQELSDKRDARKKQREAEAVIAQAENNARLERDAAWAQEHQNDTDIQLLDHLRQVAAQMDHVPCTREVLGGTYINQRFGGWTMALALADLPIPKGMKQPKAKLLYAYREKLQSETQQGSVCETESSD